MFEYYRNRVLNHGRNIGEMLTKQSNMIIEHTWGRDPHAKKVYVVKVDGGLPKVTEEHELIDVKFNIKSYQTITSDEVSYLLQFRHGEEKRHPEIAIGSYVYMTDEDDNWKWWLLVHEDERPEFRQWQILECNWTIKWISEGKLYNCLGVQRVQQSYNSGSFAMDRTTAVDNVTSIWVPTNNDTLTLDYNKRFMISDPRKYPPIVYQVSKWEDTQPIGLIKLKMTQETFNPIHDNPELMVCNYYDSSVTPENSAIVTTPKTATISYNGSSPNVKVGGSYKIFTPVFDDDLITVTQWTVSDEDGNLITDTKNYIIELDGSKLKLKVAQNYYLIGKVLVVQVYGSDGSSATLKVEVIG